MFRLLKMGPGDDGSYMPSPGAQIPDDNLEETPWRHQDITAELILHDFYDKKRRKDICKQFRKNNHPDLLIVNNMLLTGFDAHRLKRLYLGRKLKDHNLLQALTRVNRPYKQMRFGYVVDFAEIQSNWVNNHAHIITLNNKKWLEYCYFLLKTIPVVLIETGSVQKKINQENLMSHIVAFPTDKLIDTYCNITNTFREKQKQVTDEKNHLTHLRDSLLPMLMNGQVTIE